jgi:hypothetical protein
MGKAIKLCGAKTRSGRPCGHPAMANGRCRYHGGKSLGGIASPTFKTGRYSKYLPTRLMSRYQEALRDPEALRLNSEIALIDARLQDVLRRVDSGEAGSLWDKALECFARFQKAMESRDAASIPEIQNAIAELYQVLKRGQSDWEAWKEVKDLVEARRRLVDSAIRHQVHAQQVLSLEQGMLLISALANTVREHVTDRNILAKIQAGFLQLTQTSVGAVPSGE